MTPDTDEQTAREAAEAWLEGAKGVPELSRRCGYEHEAAIYGWLAGYHAGRAAGLELAAEICESECREYVKSMEEFDRRGDTRTGTNEARCAITAQFLAQAIRALKLGDDASKIGEP